MEPLNDDELKQALRAWKAPKTPESLERRVLPRHISAKLSWWRWVFTGSVRVPVPVLFMLAVAAVLAYFGMTEKRAAQAPKATVSLADFRPVENVQPQIIRRGSENK